MPTEYRGLRSDHEAYHDALALHELVEGLEGLCTRHPPSGPEATFFDGKVRELLAKAKESK
jgi:hypothetical protein